MGVEKHDKRIGSAKNPRHDESRTHLNETLLGTDSVFEDTMKVASQYKKAHEKSAIAAEMILTASHEFFDKISPQWREGVYTKEFIQWRDLTLKYLVDNFPGIAHVSLHMDEQAPHIHAVAVPIHTKTISYRRGSKEVTRIRYNDVFGDDMQTIVAARKAGNSELTKLGRMQTAYANAMKPTGLKRGISNKNLYHETIKEYNQRISTPVVTLEKLTKLPKPTLSDKAKQAIGVDTDFSRELEKVMAENAKKSKKNKETFAQLEAKARDYERMKTENEAMKKVLIEKDEKLAKLGQDLKAAENAKEIAAKLRGIDVADVAARIGITPTKQDRNAIDLLKNHAGFTYEESIAWLYNEYDEKTAVLTAAGIAGRNAERITKEKPEQPLSPLDVKTAEQVKRQLDALQASRYRVTVQVADDKETPDLRTYNMGKGKGPDGSELFYTANDITRVIPRLRRENARGYNIFITPYDDEKLYLLVDDLTDETLTKFDHAGYRPNVLQTTSKQKMQAVFVLPKQEVSEPARNALFNELNQKYGDPKITGYNHGFRLAGFTNAKPKHRTPDGQRPIVRVLKTTVQTCLRAVRWCRDFMVATTMPKQSQKQRDDDTRVLHTTIANIKNPDAAPTPGASAEATQFYHWIAERYGDQPEGPDYSRADFMLVKRMTGRFTQDDIARAVLTHSPGITERHRDVMRYLNATVGSAYRPS